MKLIATREATIGQVEPGELVTNKDGRWIVDEVRRTLAGMELLCRAEGSTSTRRTSLEFKSVEDKVTVEAGPQDRAELISQLDEMISDGAKNLNEEYGYGNGVITMTLGTRPFAKVCTRIWTLSFES